MKALLNQSTATQHYTCSERQTYTPRLDPTEATYTILKEAAPPGRGRHPSGTRSASARGGTWQCDAAGTRGEDEPEQRTRARDLMTQCLHAEPAAWPRHSTVAAWQTQLGLNFCFPDQGTGLTQRQWPLSLPLPFILCFKLYDFIIENNTC